MTERDFEVTIEDLRPGHAGKVYRRLFRALTRFAAIEDASATLLLTDGMIEGADFHIVSAR